MKEYDELRAEIELVLFKHSKRLDCGVVAVVLGDDNQKLTSDLAKTARLVAEEILNQMVLERCDPDVMPYFEDYYWLPKSIWQALKSRIGG